MMNAAHWHLALNHLPVLGTVFGLALLVLAQLKSSQELIRVSFGMFVVIAVLAVPAYLTGKPAEDAVKGLPGVSNTLLEQHEEVAQIAFTGLVILGVTALAGLALFRRGKSIPCWFAIAASALALLVGGLMAWTANLGGQIRHGEIRSGSQFSAIRTERMAATSRHRWIRDTPRTHPAPSRPIERGL